MAIFWGDLSPQTTETKANINKWDYGKLKNFAHRFKYFLPFGRLSFCSVDKIKEGFLSKKKKKPA